MRLQAGSMRVRPVRVGKCEASHHSSNSLLNDRAVEYTRCGHVNRQRLIAQSRIPRKYPVLLTFALVPARLYSASFLSEECSHGKRTRTGVDPGRRSRETALPAYEE